MSAAEPNIAASFFREGDADFVRIAIKGSSDTLIRRVTPGDVERFSREWEIYSHGVADAAPEGTPLDRVPGLSGAQVMMLKLNRIHTAEELAAVDDAVLVNLGMGMRAAHRSARLMVENNAKDAEMAEMRARIAALEAAPAKPPSARKRRATRDAGDADTGENA